MFLLFFFFFPPHYRLCLGLFLYVSYHTSFSLVCKLSLHPNLLSIVCLPKSGMFFFPLCYPQNCIYPALKVAFG